MSFRSQKLTELCELIVDCPHSTPKWTESGVIVTRNQNIKNGVLDLSSPSYTNEEDYRKRTKRAVPQAGDIIITREAPMGEVCMIPSGLKCCLGQRQVLLRPKQNVNGNYLLWALQSEYVQHQISWNEGTGSTVSNLRIPVLESLEIPRHRNEDYVAEVLSTIASKVELIKATNQTIEKIAQAIFKSWFVDFEPTKAKIAAREALLAENPAATPEQISTAEQQAAIQVIAGAGDVIPTEQLQIIADLFPNQQIDSELGEIPYGWSYCGAQELFNISIGKTPPRKESHWFSNNPTDIKWISIRDLGNSGTYVKTCSEYLTEEAVTKHKVKKAEKDTVLLSFKLTVGRVAIAAHDMCTNEAIAHFNVSDLSPPSTWTYSYLKQYDYESLGSTSSIATAINSKIIKGMPFLKSANELNSHWSEVTKPLFDALYNNTMMVDTLEKLRNELLPKLLSGDLVYEDNGVV